jgi:hypothetical protein
MLQTSLVTTTIWTRSGALPWVGATSTTESCGSLARFRLVSSASAWR